jgi:hypothetical protein
MLKCFEPKRFGGSIFFGAASSGETLLWEDIVDFTRGMLSYGHIVSYTTNMTITPILERFCDFPAELRSRLELDASLHYLELKRKNMLNEYFENLCMLRSAGVSIAIFLVISDIYIPYLREISELCQKEIGLLPIAGILRNYEGNGAEIAMKYSSDVDKLVKETCDVRQWELQKRIYGQRRTEFCYAGEYSLNMNLGTGDYTKCWGSNGIEKNWEKLLKGASFVNKAINRIFKESRNMFKNPNELIKFEPIGRCPFYDCICASYLCWGLIPDSNVETHSKTYFKRDFVSKEIWDFMDFNIDQQSVRL